MWPDRAVARDIVLFSTADWEHPFWTNKQHVACQLADRGFRVLYVESLGLRAPQLRSRDVSRIGRRLRRALDPLRQVRDNLWVASPLALPWHASSLVRGINHRWLALCVNAWRHRLQFDQPLVWTYNPLLQSTIEAIDPSLVVYHCVDDLRAAPHMPSAAIEAAEERLIRTADVVFTTSLALQSRAASLNPQAARYLPNVADFDHFAQARDEGPIPADLAAIPRPRIGFVGAVSQYKVDFELIAQVAEARSDWQWVLIGQVGEGEHETRMAKLNLPNVQLLGPRRYDELPDYLRGFDVATIPCPANAYTAAMFPMKFFEYLSADLPVIASHVPALAPFASAHERADTPRDFEAAVARVLAGERPDVEACTRIARQYTWEWRTEEMLRIVRQAWQRRHDWPTIERVTAPRAKAG